jgi:pimeloyl-ACP methyl ester carboxylesterase
MTGPFATRRSRVVARLALYGGAILVGLPLAFSEVMIRAPRQRAGAPPAGFREIRVLSDGLRLRGWSIEGRPDLPGAVLVHGLGDSIESYLGSAHALNRRGHGVLLLDLRGHGGSEGDRTTLGGREREDVRAAMRALQARQRPGQGLILLGVSMGAVAALRAAAAEPLSVRAVVAEAPFDSYRESVYHHARLFYRLPRWFPLIPLSIAMAEWRAGFDADDVDAVAAARRVRAPLLAIVDGADPRMPEAVVRRVFDAHPGPKRLWVAPGAPHAGASLTPGYWEEVFGFLRDNGM